MDYQSIYDELCLKHQNESDAKDEFDKIVEMMMTNLGEFWTENMQRAVDDIRKNW